MNLIISFVCCISLLATTQSILNCSQRILLSLDDSFLNALRKIKSDGDLCKISADGNELGPYQISKEIYDDAVRVNPTLRTKGRKYEFVWGVDSKNYSEEVVKSYICLHGSIVQERRRNHQLSIVNLGAIYAGGSSNNNRANNLLFGRELAQLIFSGATANDTYQACDPNCQPRQCCVDEKCLCIDSITTVATVLECKDCNLTCKNEGTMLSNCSGCLCIPGYEGITCDINTDDCVPNPCQNGETCVDGINSYTCNCVDGYNGTNCGNNIDDCSPNPCQNGGTCTDGIESYICNCVDGYNGTNCENNINECFPNKCQNGGICFDDINSYTCTCIDGYNGTNCENDINDCIPNPCQNEGTCIDGINSYTCSCVMGYNGTNCEKDINDCIPNPCQNGGTCIDKINSYTCICIDGYNGTNCEKDINDCIPNPCQNGGTCIDKINSYTCICIDGYNGTDCEKNINDCIPNLCQNGGTCIDGINSYTCSCVMGYNGTNCEVKVDECIPNPCNNKGICTNLINDYNCTCHSIYFGRNCSVFVPVITISPADSIQGGMVGSPQYINCAVDTVNEVQLMIIWGGPNGNNIINDNRVKITQTTASDTTYTSSLQFTYLMEGDEGTYTCNVIISEISWSQSIVLSSLIIPTPTVNVVVTSPQKVGQSLTLYCNGTTVRGITSSVYIVWRRGNTIVNTTHVTATTMLGNLLVYRDSYTIMQLSISDDGVVYECTLVIQTSLEVRAHDTVRLDVNENDTGDYKCFVRNQYNGTGQSEVAKLILDQFCNPVTVNYTGFSVTWNKTQAGITVEILCTGHGLSGTVRRRCIRDHLWEEIFDCFRQETNMLLHQAINLTLSKNKSNETETIAITSNIANALVNVTTPTQEPIFAQDINLAVNTLSVLNSVTETFIANLTVNDTFFEDATSVINNLLSDTNQESWNQLKRSSPSTSQDLVSSAEQITKLLSETLTNNATESIKTRPNIIIKAERLTNDGVHEGYMFPDEDDNLTAYNGGNARLMVSSDVLQSISFQELTIASTVIRNGTGLRLPSSNNRLGDPISPIFSLQINPLPESQILVKNPIMLMFDVDRNATILDQNIVQDEQDFTVYDVSCNFYDNTLVTNDNLNQIGGWSTDGLTVDGSHSNETLVTCLTTHLTSFAVLVSIQDERPPSTADKALSIISYIGCSISLVFLCISIIFLSYTIYKTKDKKNHLFIHLNLCIALSLGLVVFISGIENAIRWEESCKFVAALLQYLFISAFCWMLCEGVMLYMMLVTVFGNKLNKRRFFFVLGWGPALLIVGISAGIAHKHYGTDYYCWIKSNDGAIAAFIAPIGAIMMINCIFFAITLKVLCQQKTMSKQVSSNKDTVKNILKAAVLLLPLLGMTWIVGIFAVNNETQLFAWIFAILNSLQGVFIFLLHVIRNKQVVKEIREHYNFMRRSEMFNRLHSGRGSGNTSTSGISSKAKSFQNTSSKVSGHDKNISTTSSGFSSKNLAIEMSLKDEAFEDSEGGHLKSTTFKKLEGSIIEEHDVGMVSRDPTEEERKSITEEDGEAIVYSRKE